MHKDEMETILRTSEAEDIWTIYTCNKAMQSKCLKFAQEHRGLAKLVAEDSQIGSMTFEIEKDRISWRLKEPISDERREAMRKTALERFGGGKKE